MCVHEKFRSFADDAPAVGRYVDDGDFNRLQRVCTYVRSRSQVLPSAARGFKVPHGMELVSMYQVKQVRRIMMCVIRGLEMVVGFITLIQAEIQ